MLRLVPVVIVTGLAACSGSDKDDPTDTGVSGSDTGTVDTDTDTDPTDTDSTVDPGEPGVSGVLLDPAGAPAPFTDVLCCMTLTCLTLETDADGRFVFPLEAGDAVAVKTHPELFVQPRWAAALEPAVIVDGHVDLGEVHVPDLPAGVPLSDGLQTIAVGDGLELTLDRDALTPELGVFLYDAAARLLPAAWIPPYPGLGDTETVRAVYALHPFATESAVPIGIRVPTDLPDGTVVSFRAVSHLDGTLSAPATGRVEGGFAATDAGQGVSLLTHLVVTTP